MDEVARAVLPYLMHTEVRRSGKCLCPADSWAPCGGQYEGRYEDSCPEHGRGRMPFPRPAHYPVACGAREGN